MTDRYEIQCPRCGGALVIPANNDAELQEFWKSCEGAKFLCPGCGKTFRGLCEKTDFPIEDEWGITVDKNGSRFGRADKLRRELFEKQRDPYLLNGEVVINISKCNGDDCPLSLAQTCRRYAATTGERQSWISSESEEGQCPNYLPKREYAAAISTRQHIGGEDEEEGR